MSEHVRHQDDVGAYLLGALNDLERQAFERHLRGCAECQEELARLRPAADALPGSVQQFEPPARLKASLMEVVRARGARHRRCRAARVPTRAGSPWRPCSCSASWSALASRSSAETRPAPSQRRQTRHCRRQVERSTSRTVRAPSSCTTCRNFVARASTRCGCSTATSWFPRRTFEVGASGTGARAAARGGSTPTACT